MDISLSDYQAALDALFVRTTGVWKFGLDTTRALLAALGDPHHQYPVFHVGGTNGKGSVVATLDALLRAHGFRVGRYTSPHLVDFRERMVVDGDAIPEQEVERFLHDRASLIDRTGATFFEATTCLAFDHFARCEVDVAIIEVGLGGRLDATNVVSPLCAGVTTIGVDHVEYLGDTPEAIAREKGGIFKSGAAAVIGDHDPAIGEQLAAMAEAVGASGVRRVDEDISVNAIDVTARGTSFRIGGALGDRALRTPLIGAHQASNTVMALTMLDAAGRPFAAAADRAERALSTVQLAGRFDWWGDVIFDVAHNPAAAAVLAETVARVDPPRPLTLLLGVLADKDWRAIMSRLAPTVDRIVLAEPPSAPPNRAWSLDEAYDYALTLGVAVSAHPDFPRALSAARAGAATTLITGSFHTVGDAMRCLQRSPLAG